MQNDFTSFRNKSTTIREFTIFRYSLSTVVKKLNLLIFKHLRTFLQNGTQNVIVSYIDLVKPIGIKADSMTRVQSLFELAAESNRLGVALTRVGLVVVLVWIGSLKAYRYEDEGIVPFVANSPLMSFFYQQPAEEYRQHMNREGELVPANRAWHERNGTYVFAYGLGSVIVIFGLMIALHPWLPQVSALGSFLVFAMSFVTLSFLVTTPECWVPALGVLNMVSRCCPAGRLVVKDAIMLGAALVTMADSAKAYLRKSGSISSEVSRANGATQFSTDLNRKISCR
ncbi:MAG: DUF417 family protein [Planctomycetaceae bacterium]